MSVITKIDWEYLIEEHYNSACRRNPKYSQKYSREEMKNWWFERINNVRNNPIDIKNLIEGSTHANNNGYNFHPV